MVLAAELGLWIRISDDSSHLSRLGLSGPPAFNFNLVTHSRSPHALPPGTYHTRYTQQQHPHSFKSIHSFNTPNTQQKFIHSTGATTSEYRYPKTVRLFHNSHLIFFLPTIFTGIFTQKITSIYAWHSFLHDTYSKGVSGVWLGEE